RRVLFRSGRGRGHAAVLADATDFARTAAWVEDHRRGNDPRVGTGRGFGAVVVVVRLRWQGNDDRRVGGERARAAHWTACGLCGGADGFAGPIVIVDDGAPD